MAQSKQPSKWVDPYELLGVTQHSTCQQVRKRYYALACLCHPDRGGTSEQMQTLHHAYQYVLKHVAMNRDNVTYEDMEKDFADFCASQTAAPPPFVDIHAEAFNLPRFNELFDLRVGSSSEVDGAFAEGGYATVPSDVTLDYQPVETCKVPMFSSAVIIYKEPHAVVMPQQTVRDLTGTPLDDYSCNVGTLQASDYKAALSPPHPAPAFEMCDVMTAYHQVLADRGLSEAAPCTA